MKQFIKKIYKTENSLVFLTLIVGTPIFGQTDTNKKPNILLILSDDHSYPFLGCYGNKDLNTPNLDRMAEEGVRFDNAFTTAPQSVPSRASLLTGRSVIDIRMSRFSAPLPRETKTIIEYLKEKGYYTGICGRTYHLDGPGAKFPESEEVMVQYKLRTFKDRVDYLNQVDYSKTNDAGVLVQFQEFLDIRSKNKPFFMWMNFSDPHRSFDAKEYEPDPKSLTIPAYFPDTRELRKDLAGYYGEINRLDHHMGGILNELEKRGLKENTMIVFIGDNGGALLRGKGTLYDIGIHVPLIINGPLVKEKGRNSGALISGEDIAPTILSFAGIVTPEKMTGISFHKIITNEPFDGREYVFAERGPHARGLPTNTANFDLIRTVFNKKYKLIYEALWQLPYQPVDFSGGAFWKELEKMNKEGQLEEKFSKALFQVPREMFQLYDLENDPYEFNNLSGKEEYKKIERELKGVLLKWMILNQDYLPLPLNN
ncbi:MAG: sulfatase [Porphyromonadaceae bacterium]|nr:sulfatase [Porphyromonadaceae bacterium]